MTLDELVTRVSRDVPEAPLLLVKESLQRAQRQLSEDGNVWTEHQSLAVTDGDPPFAEIIAQTADSEPVRVMRLSVDDSPIEFSQTEPGRLEFKRLPQSGPEILLAIRPTTGANLPSDLLTYWQDGLRHGALSELFMLPQSWQNPALHEYHQARFRDSLARARMIARGGYQSRGSRVRPRSFL